MKFDKYGNLISDSYTTMIEKGHNVITRLAMEYSKICDTVFDEINELKFFQNGEHFISRGYIYSSEDVKEVMNLEQGGVDGANLELDKEYDINEIGKLGGIIDIAVSFADNEYTKERAEASINLIKEMFDERGVKFFAMNFTIFNEEGNVGYEINNLKYDEIET